MSHCAPINFAAALKFRVHIVIDVMRRASRVAICLAARDCFVPDQRSGEWQNPAGVCR